jgi:hypothetical protein
MTAHGLDHGPVGDGVVGVGDGLVGVGDGVVRSRTAAAYLGVTVITHPLNKKSEMTPNGVRNHR